MADALIKPDILQWARERSQLSVEQLAESYSKKPERIESWEEGSSKPTFRQAQDLANKLHIPFGYLFLSEPPEVNLPIPDLRTVKDEQIGLFSQNFLDLVNDMMRKQDWYREHLLEEGAEELPFVGRFSLDDPTDKVALDIRTELGIDNQLRRQARSWKDFLGLLIANADETGILVMRSGVVGSNTRRSLSTDEFLGFAIADSLAPLIFINGNDWEARKIFTFAHEMAHIWTGQSGVSNIDPKEILHQRSKRVERICNRIAAEVLVPSSDFQDRWQTNATAEENVYRLARFYRVSSIVLLRRALDLQLINRKEFFEKYDEETESFKRREKSKGDGGGNFYVTLKSRNSPRVTSAIVSAAMEGRLLYRDASRLLGIQKTETLFSVATKFGIR